MPETKADSHSQGLGFCGKVRAGQGLGGSGMRGCTSEQCPAKGAAVKVEVVFTKTSRTLVKGREEWRGQKAGLGRLGIGSDGQSLRTLAERHRFIPQPRCTELESDGADTCAACMMQM